jgi:hypothetical protein
LGLKLTVQQAEALARLRTSGDFKIFEEVVREYERELVERLLLASDPVWVHRCQGGVETTRALAQFVADAPATLQKLSRK